MMKSSRRHLELQGPRPAPLMVSKNSQKVMKKKPVVVYLISPKIIHVQPEEFMGLVQRLTGNNNNQGYRASKVSNNRVANSLSCSSCSTTFCSINQEAFVKESREKHNNNRADEFYGDRVPFGIPTTTTSNFAEKF
ncbi:VQ motif-containing protein 8, chloroplastic-like [Malus sylvestris]|uniref:VQ motif-containing protein 8, chloroplastic-like n=1 Tax=Malus sylvestris TaxID=3752 RepID=UPI0021AD165A|nr:VQ motif-containing protein 8, chloroplastic-like [Malus sylvestris]